MSEPGDPDLTPEQSAHLQAWRTIQWQAREVEARKRNGDAYLLRWEQRQAERDLRTHMGRRPHTDDEELNRAAGSEERYRELMANYESRQRARGVIK